MTTSDTYRTLYSAHQCDEIGSVADVGQVVVVNCFVVVGHIVMVQHVIVVYCVAADG